MCGEIGVLRLGDDEGKWIGGAGGSNPKTQEAQMLNKKQTNGII